MKIAITGSKGYVGRTLMKYPDTCAVQGDIRDKSAIEEELAELKPDFLIHLAAKTDVEYCEVNKRICDQVNYWGTVHVATACDRLKIPMAFLSTFQVFPGRTWPLSTYTEKDKPNPLNYYGMSKLVGEALRKAFPIKIIRTGYIYDYERLEFHIDRLDEQPVAFPTFQFRNFTPLEFFCDSLMHEYIPKFDTMPEILHMGGSDTVSWYQFMKDVAEKEGIHPPIPRHKDIQSGFAPRPHRAGLNVSLSHKLGLTDYSYKGYLITL